MSIWPDYSSQPDAFTETFQPILESLSLTSSSEKLGHSTVKNCLEEYFSDSGFGKLGEQQDPFEFFLHACGMVDSIDLRLTNSNSNVYKIDLLSKTVSRV